MPAAVRAPPDGLAESDQVKPLPLPPDAVNAWLPLGATVAVAGEMAIPAVTVTLRVAVLPSESVTWISTDAPTTAIYAHTSAELLRSPPDGLAESDQVKPL